MDHHRKQQLHRHNSVAAGTLAVSGSLNNTGQVNVAGMLTGGGTVGNVAVYGGGGLAPGNLSGAGTLTATTLTLNSGSVLDYTLGAAAGGNGFVSVGQNLQLAGNGINLAISSGGLLGLGSYELMSYGSLNNNAGGYPASTAFSLTNSAAYVPSGDTASVVSSANNTLDLVIAGATQRGQRHLADRQRLVEHGGQLERQSGPRQPPTGHGRLRHGRDQRRHGHPGQQPKRRQPRLQQLGRGELHDQRVQWRRVDLGEHERDGGDQQQRRQPHDCCANRLGRQREQPGRHASTGSALTIAGSLSETVADTTLSVSGGGALILSGTDQYTGGTTVNAATLALTSSNALPTSGLLTIGSGGRLVLGGGAGIGALLGASSPISSARSPSARRRRSRR